MFPNKPLIQSAVSAVLFLLEVNMKTLTHQEAHKRQDAMRKYFAEGHTAKETAEEFDTTVGYVRRICKGVRTGNQYTNGLFDREANAIRYINERTPMFEYAGNFTGVDGYVDLKCKTCGRVMRKSFVCVKQSKARCQYCYEKDIEERKQKKQVEHDKIMKQRAEDRKVQAALNRKYKQETMRVCPICNSVFIGSKKYCSAKCRDKNHYMMKDGYRYLFPLDEVYKRDNGVCYLCGGLCDWNDYKEVDGVIVYGNNYPSRDHVIPKSKGGLNDWGNIRLAHRWCNSCKADSPWSKNEVPI
jgi:5-methylcytosine-specific restriction endonuclease McrA